MLKRNIIVIAVLTVLVAPVVVFYAYCGRDSTGSEGASGRQRPPTAVETEQVQRRSVSRVLELVGETVALEKIILTSQVDGIVAYCPWNPGDVIEEPGAELVRLERELYRIDVQRAEAKVSELEAETNLLHSNYRRQKRLYENEVVGEESYEKSRQEYAAKKARLAGAKADLLHAQARLDESVINAPFAGVITAAHVRRGDSIRSGQALIEMMDPDSVVIRSAVPESSAGAVERGMKAKIRFDSLPENTYDARIIRIYPYLDQRHRTRTVEFELKKNTDNIIPGVFARIELKLETAADALTLHADAIVRTRDGRTAVFVVEEGRARRRIIEKGLRRNTVVQVLDGLQEGDMVVTAGADGISDGEEVRVSGAGGEGGRKN